MVDAYLYFYGEIEQFFLGGKDDGPLISPDKPLSARLDESFLAMKNALHVVAIDLDHNDDAPAAGVATLRGDALTFP